MAVNMTVLFDTNIVIDALNGIRAADEEYSRHNTVHISIITWMEVMVGVDENCRHKTERILRVQAALYSHTSHPRRFVKNLAHGSGTEIAHQDLSICLSPLLDK